MKLSVCTITTLAVGLTASMATANITYQVNRTVGNGTVVGFVETDGTIGTLDSTNIVDWSLVLTAPNLNGGPSVQIDKVDSLQTFVVGSGTTATATDLSYDFGAASGFFLLQGGDADNYNFWCLEIGGCTDPGFGESIGFDASGANTTEHDANRSGVVVFASVPAPGSVALLGFGGLGAIRRRRRN